MEKERLLERVSAARGIVGIMDELITATAEAIDRLEKRIEKLEAPSHR